MYANVTKLLPCFSGFWRKSNHKHDQPREQRFKYLRHLSTRILQYFWDATIYMSPAGFESWNHVYVHQKPEKYGSNSIMISFHYKWHK